MRSLDWASTPLGPTHKWPQSLRSTLSVCLGTHFPVALHWGEEYVLLFNDAYVPILGEQYSAALGRPTRKALANIWNVLQPRFARVMRDGESIAVQSALYVSQRR